MAVFCYSREATSRKPMDARPFQSPRNYVQEDLSVEEIANLCGTGHAWRAGIYDDGITSFAKKNVRANQVIALDFDSVSQSPQEAVEYASNVGLPVSFWYYSFSQNPKSAKSGRFDCTTYKISISNTAKTDTFLYKTGFNFRLCWVFEREIEPAEYEAVYPLLEDVFSAFNPDRATKDCSRLWYGGCLGAEVVRKEPLPISCLGRYSAQAKVREGIEPRKAMKRKKGFIPEYADVLAPEAVVVYEGWTDKLQGRCPLFDRWKRGDYLDYNERLALLSNLRYLKHSNTRKSVIEEVLSFYKPETYAGHTCDEQQIRDKFRDNSLKPIPIVSVRGGERVTMPDFFSGNYDEPIIPAQERCGREELDSWMNENVSGFLNDRDPGIKTLVSQTGSGKTHRIIDYIVNDSCLSSKKVVYSAPKHSNLIEVEKKILDKASFTRQGLIHRCPEKEVTTEDILYLQMGLPAKTKSAERRGFIEKLFSPDEKGVFLMTHSLLVSLTGLHVDEIIIDEDINNSLIRETKLELPNLSTVIPYLEQDTAHRLTDFVQRVRDKDRENGIEIDLSLLREEVCPQVRRNIKKYLADTSASLLAVGLFDSEETDGKLSRGGYIRMKRKSPLITDAISTGTPIRVFSATPMNGIAKHYYGIAIPEVVAPLAVNAGRIIQYRGNSGKKGNDNENFKALSEYMKNSLSPDIIANSLLITFKGTKKDVAFWEDEGFKVAKNNKEEQIHLMNNSGLDFLKGRSLIICGKWDFPDIYYQDIWDDIGDGSELGQRQNCSIELNGISQSLYLFQQAEIQEIQLGYIRNAIEQAMGRARALREMGATVYIFANYVPVGVDEVRD